MITLKPLTKDHFILLHKWLNQDYMYKYWEDKVMSMEDVITKYTPRINSTIYTYIIHYNNIPIGLIQTEQTSNLYDFKLDGNAMGIDLFIGEVDYVNKGLGTKILKQFIKEVCFSFKGVKYITIDPNEDNKRAIACYKKVGFKEVQTKLCSDCESHNTTYMVLKKEEF